MEKLVIEEWVDRCVAEYPNTPLEKRGKREWDGILKMRSGLQNYLEKLKKEL